MPEPRLADRLHRVFAARDGRDLPPRLPESPASWARDYAVLIADLGVGTDTVEAALTIPSRADALALTIAP